MMHSPSESVTNIHLVLTCNCGNYVGPIDQSAELRYIHTLLGENVVNSLIDAIWRWLLDFRIR